MNSGGSKGTKEEQHTHTIITGNTSVYIINNIIDHKQYYRQWHF